MKANQKYRASNSLTNDDARFSVTALLSVALAIVGVIIGAQIGMRLLSTMAPGFISDGANLSENISTADYGDPLANSLAPNFGLLISLAILFALVGLAFAVVFIYKSSRGGGLG
jgi:predicted membrane-bound spermidine synthase